MLTVARAIAGRPKFLIADEASFGLAPRVAARVMDELRSAADAGTGMLVVEQHIRAGLRIADRGYVVHGGRVVEEGTAAELAARLERIEATYLTGRTDPPA